MEATSPAGPRFTISFPESASKEPPDGRLLLLISTDNSKQPRLQIGEDLSTQQVFGIDVDGLKPGQPATIITIPTRARTSPTRCTDCMRSPRTKREDDRR